MLAFAQHISFVVFLKVRHHSKAITSLMVDGSGSRVLSGGLDAQIKIYDLAEWTVTHSMR